MYIVFDYICTRIKYLVRYIFLNKRVMYFFNHFQVSLILLFLFLLSGCHGKTDEKEIVIISTNDVHGQIQQFPKLATFVDRVKAEYPNVILVDAGDRFTGNPYVDYAEERGLPIITLMNELGYAIGTLGNHEFDFGQKILRTRINDATFPIICANINSSQSELDSIAPYYIIEKDGIKLCFLGLIQTETDNIPSTNPEHLQKITFDNYLDKIEDYRKLKSSCHAFIGLTHLGVDSDSILATRMPELDMIIGGHSHTLLEKPKRVNNVLIGQTGIKLQYAGLTTLKFKGGKLTERIYKSCLIDTITQADSSMTEKVKFFVNPPRFKQIIGTATLPFESRESIANLVTDAMLSASSSDIAFYNQGGIRITQLPQGDITLEQLFSIEPFGNHIVTHEMSLKEIKALILNRFNREDHAIDLFVSPGNYTIIRDQQGNGTDVLIQDRNGKPLVDEQIYKVALNNYVSVDYDFPDRGKGQHTDISVVNAMIKFVQSHQPVQPTLKRTYIK